MILTQVTDESKCCCSCKHNKRVPHKEYVFCHCDKDGHNIGYVANFEQVCKEWEKTDEGKLTEREKAELTQREIRKEKEEAIIFFIVISIFIFILCGVSIIID